MGIDSVSTLGRFARFTLLASTMIGSVIPFRPKMPTAGLDPSWVWGLNAAIDQGLQFGEEIIFTLGPYASVYTQSFGPGSSRLLLLGTVILALGYTSVVSRLADQHQPSFYLILSALSLVVLTNRDTLLLLYPLVLLWTHVRSQSSSTPGSLAARGLTRSKREIGTRRASTSEQDRSILQNLFLLRLNSSRVFVEVSSLALLPLVKGSLLFPSVLVLSLIGWIRLQYKSFRGLSGILITYALATVLLWSLAGQNLSNLLNYVRRTVEMSSSYSGAMSLEGRISEIALFVVSSLLVILYAVRSCNHRLSIPLNLMLVVTLYIGFRLGFTRHDGHALIASQTLIGVLLLVKRFSRQRPFYLVLLSVLVTWVFIDGNYSGTSTKSVIMRFRSVYVEPLTQSVAFLKDRDLFHREYWNSVQSIARDSSLPSVQGTVDVFPYDIAAVLSKGLTWSPRPILQSYAAYTSELAELNASHFYGPDSPNNVFFSVNPIDYRFPSLEDGSSWIPLLQNYRLVGHDGTWLHLARRENGKTDLPKLRYLSTSSSSIDTKIVLPQLPHDEALFVNLRFNGSLKYKLSQAFFKPPEVWLTASLTDGSEVSYRFVPSAGESACLLYPMVGSTVDFGQLYLGAEGLKRVESLSFTSSEGAGFSDWVNDVEIEFFAFELQEQFEVEILGSRHKAQRVVESLQVVQDSSCLAHMDELQIAPVAEDLNRRDYGITLKGWLVAPNVSSTPIPRPVLILTDAHDSIFTVPLRRALRPDLRTAFGVPESEFNGLILDSIVRLESPTLAESESAQLGYFSESGLVQCDTTVTSISN